MAQMKETQEDKTLRHIQEMKEQLRKFFGTEGVLYASGLLSPKQEEAFLENILFMEGVEEQPLFDQLEKIGIRLPAASSMDDAQLHKKLWEVIHGMARLEHYLSSTDHLSDRQLYERLWTDLLREPTSVCSDHSTASCHIDILGGCSQEDLMTRLKYYADEDERESWAAEFPEDVIPPHEPLPYDRDRHLPAHPVFGRRLR
ncbi:MAG: hypothetical protein QUT30_16415 [Acidobacteriota bacterium]|jgi:hypothetical protein|nr:hypothetical protein [Acidobacteriota bacterium]